MSTIEKERLGSYCDVQFASELIKKERKVSDLQRQNEVEAKLSSRGDL